MSKLVKPHASPDLKPLLLKGEQLKAERAKAEKLPKVIMTSRETSDLIMMAIGAFTPLDGFMTKADWKGVCAEYKMANGVFWPIPITLSAKKEVANSIKEGQEIALVDEETNELMGSMKVTEKYTIDKEYECKQVFRTNDLEHPGVAKVMSQAEVNLAGPVKVFSESYYPVEFKDIYMRPAESRKLFEQKGWSTVAALQLRNPMHRSHEYLAKIAVEVVDGLFIHQLVGKLKAGDIPADVRVKCIDMLVEHYFVKDTVIQGGYPMEMRYGGPREALLHAVFRQNFGCSHLIVGRDHAGVGDYYGPFDAQKIFDEIPPGSLELKPLKIDWTFYCHKCRGMASMRTCPHGKEDRLLLSGTMLRKMLSEGGEVPADFSRPEVLKILQQYYAGLTEKVEIKLHGAATGEAAKKEKK
ncbi:MAG: sulfate adenylyltransferase [Candidatus Abyssobacteria bacterium SURF_17]|uniref:Sulfate adenylyltransferase n=1 Tax=Candidatus Abyssobacteria bacterium SURF_17 TaxID=2093361 RepID=A0A419EYC3_9BACT|nr:MAG: sulfate adenylyltransferase [Candidatus Abyssubacteria bacterium SURF_17]